MIFKMYSVFDSKVGAYITPVFYRSNGEALRAFSASVNDVQHNFHNYAEDYTLFELGSFSDDKARFDIYPSPISLGVAIEFKRTFSDSVVPLDTVSKVS